MIFGTSLLSTAYLPPIEYFVAIANSGRVEIECGEMYQKQSYRTRCHINGANGLLVLTLPVLRSAAKG
ncbi:MAG: WbqC family protein, partial [Bacteroidales bacterium]|nr:WbqC family protein [Bacteroidales bacterium]